MVSVVLLTVNAATLARSFAPFAGRERPLAVAQNSQQERRRTRREEHLREQQLRGAEGRASLDYASLRSG